MSAAHRHGPPSSARGPYVRRRVVTGNVAVVYDDVDDGHAGGTELMPAAYPAVAARSAAIMPTMRLDAHDLIPRSSSLSGVRARQTAPTALATLGVSRFELAFAFGAAVVVGLGAALAFVYLG